MCGPRFSPGRGFGQKSRRGSRDLAGTLPATTACARGGWSRKSAPEAAQCPPGTTFPAWPFLGPAASFAAGSSARRLVERNGARQRRAAQPSAAPPRHTIPIEVAQRNKRSISIISIAVGPGSAIPSSLFSHFVIEVSGTRGIGIIVDLSKPAPACRLPQALGKALGTRPVRRKDAAAARQVKEWLDGDKLAFMAQLDGVTDDQRVEDCVDIWSKWNAATQQEFAQEVAFEGDKRNRQPQGRDRLKQLVFFLSSARAGYWNPNESPQQILLLHDLGSNFLRAWYSHGPWWGVWS